MHTATSQGLLLQGAELQGTTLVEAATDAAEIVLMPSLAMGYSQLSSSKCNGDSTLKVPLYHDATREQLLVEIALPLGRENPDIWVRCWAPTDPRSIFKMTLICRFLLASPSFCLMRFKLAELHLRWPY